jgi:putative DNA-invertase from lambdoid prophage Rac
MTFMDGQRPKSNCFTPKVLALVANGRSYRLIARELGLSKTPSSISSNGNRCPSAWTFASYVK